MIATYLIWKKKNF